MLHIGHYGVTVIINKRASYLWVYCKAPLFTCSKESSFSPCPSTLFRSRLFSLSREEEGGATPREERFDESGCGGTVACVWFCIVGYRPQVKDKY